MLGSGLGGGAALGVAGGTGVELVSPGILPGKTAVDGVEGARSGPAPLLVFPPSGPSFSGTFYSAARHRRVGYTVAYPPGHRQGERLPLVIMLHGYGENHASALVGMSPAQALAVTNSGPVSMVTVDGGDGYWNPHPGDNPMAMVIGELIPLCQRLGLARAARGVGAVGVSVGGFRGLLLAEKYPHLITAVAAISPAIWTSYAQARQ